MLFGINNWFFMRGLGPERRRGFRVEVAVTETVGADSAGRGPVGQDSPDCLLNSEGSDRPCT